jgi:hypothetical protein
VAARRFCFGTLCRRQPDLDADGSDLFDVAKKDCSHWAVDHTVFRLPSGEIAPAALIKTP